LIKNECTRIHLLDHLLSGKLATVSTPFDRDKAYTLANIKEHEALLRAVEKQDAVAARAAMEAHLQPVVDGSILALEHEASHQQAAFRKLQIIDRAVRS